VNTNDQLCGVAAKYCLMDDGDSGIVFDLTYDTILCLVFFMKTG
jgi:hypothetical protein